MKSIFNTSQILARQRLYRKISVFYPALKGISVFLKNRFSAVDFCILPFCFLLSVFCIIPTPDLKKTTNTFSNRAFDVTVIHIRYIICQSLKKRSSSRLLASSVELISTEWKFVLLAFFDLRRVVLTPSLLEMANTLPFKFDLLTNKKAKKFVDQLSSLMRWGN